MVEVNERVGWPESLPELFSGDKATRPLQQHFQYLKGLAR
jgi:hypothetical protein